MESWSDDFFEVLEVVANELEQFCTDIAKEVNGAIEAFADVSEAVFEQMQTTFVAEFDRQLSEFVDPLVDACLGIEGAIGEAAQPLLHTVDPLLNNHPACVGCRHYHGQVYSGTPLICGMHPYGWESEQCPDWQSTWQD
ncbi:hypothetical protein H6F43_15355 [Leptolyngbya sp. FACHB-36]|uniref:hypothetical protein n=1 Tax=Leptolyngbya sp. FACHB-36 TaxID=2692808 RepID=UPI001680D277|nr:hypothetical protein [Leptolyngbya sp. FACHB-36]MBD2021556.1 hypothetical protein [Leptolyngbya sp. FACHB-36]